MEKIKKLKILIPSIFILGLLFGYVVFRNIGYSTEETKSILDDFPITSLREAGSVSCVFERTTAVSYNGSAIEYSALHKESSPLSFSFVGIDTDTPTLSANGTAGTVYSANIRVLSNTDEKIVLSEVTPTEGNVFIYTIYKNNGVAIWTKQYSLMGIPAGILSMGKCSVIANKTVKDVPKKSQQEEEKRIESLKAFMEAKKEKEMGATKADEYQAEKTWVTVLKDNGDANKTSKIFTVNSKKFKVIWDYSGDSNFIVKAVNPEDNILGGCSVANVVGAASAYTICDKGPGTFYIHVKYASGPWSIEVLE